jgi:AP-4 complex subunit epsilon-1
VSRLLDACELQCGNDGEQYASYLKDLFAIAEGEIQGRTEELPVLEAGVEMILSHIRECMYIQPSLRPTTADCPS